MSKTRKTDKLSKCPHCPNWIKTTTEGNELNEHIKLIHVQTDIFTNNKILIPKDYR